MGHNPIDEAEWKKMQENKRRADQLDKLRAESAARTQSSIEAWKGSVSERGQSFEHALAVVAKQIEERRGKWGWKALQP